MTSTAIPSSTTLNNPQTQPVPQTARSTRTNPSRASRTLGRSSFALGHGSSTAVAGDDAASTVPHGFYPALTHFTDAVAALPREFRRHNSLLKEVDAKAWALEDQLLRLLVCANESEPPVGGCPDLPAPIVGGVFREDFLPRELQSLEQPESKNRRLHFNNLRHTLSDLLMTADEKNHVITNANDELDRQMLRLDTVFPYMAGEISEETRLGSLTHWAYSNKNTAKAAERERPRRETASHRHDHGHHENEAASRSEARREAALARKQRRAQHADSDLDEHRVTASRKGHASRARGSGAGAGVSGQSAAGHAGASGSAGSAAPAKRRKVERPPTVDTGAAAMERSNSGVGNSTGRANSKDVPAQEAGKKRTRAPNGTTGARKRQNHVASMVESPVLASSPLATGVNVSRNTASPGPNAATRPSSSRAQNHFNSIASSSRQRPSSSASNRVGSSSNKAAESKSANKDTPLRTEAVSQAHAGAEEADGEENAAPATAATKSSAPASTKQEDTEEKPSKSIETNNHQPLAPPAPAATATTSPSTNINSIIPSMNTNNSATTAPSSSKSRTSKTSTPMRSEPNPPQRARQTRSTDPAPSKRSQKKSSTTPVVHAVAPSEDDEESLRGGDDEDDESEPRYCYCNEVSFGDMVACDNDACPREWFHLSCVGLSRPPGKNVKWYCNECKESMRRSRNGK